MQQRDWNKLLPRDIRLAAGAFVFAFAIGSTAAAASRQPEVIRLEDYPAAKVWKAYNSEVRAVKDSSGGTVWRWKITGGKEAFLWLNEELPFHDQIPQYQRFVYDINFTEGQINHVWPRAVGLLAPPGDKLWTEWNAFHATSPHKTWITYQQVFDDPSWSSEMLSKLPDGVNADRTKFLGIDCVPKGESCTIELRNCRLVRDAIRVEKPYLTSPLGWPVLEKQRNSEVRYRTPYFAKNVTDRPVKVTGKVVSRHRRFSVRTEPAETVVAPGKTVRFDVVAALPASKAAAIPPMTEETAVVYFVPDGNEALAYRTETFCTAPLPTGYQQQVMLSPKDVAELKAKGKSVVDDAAKFWMNMDLADQHEIPGYAGWTPSTKCPVCGRDTMRVTANWLEVKCSDPLCGHKESHTILANALWISTWAAIHQSGPSVLSLGRAYVATGDERYARKAIDLLTLIAKHYRDLPWHNSAHPQGYQHEEPPSPDAWTNGASARWGSSPTYGTDWMVQGLAELQNMIIDSPSWTPQARKLVYEGFWLPVVTEITKIVPGISNMNDIINRDLVLIGHDTGDANIVYRGAYYHTGIMARLRDISPDGFSDEGSALNYHLGGIREWLPTLELLANSSLPWGDARPRAVAALKMPLLRAALDGTAYNTGNSGIAWFPVHLNDEVFRLADKIFGPKEWPRVRSYSKDPVLFPDGGWAILRSGDTVSDQVMVNMDYGRTHGHGDPDRMNLSVFAYGVPFSADPGSTYNFSTDAKPGPAEESMASPFAHNTVVVDGKQQLTGAGRLVLWKPEKDCQEVVAEVQGVYPGVVWRRSAALVGGVVVVVDNLHSDQSHRYEVGWHNMGSFSLGSGCSAVEPDAPLGDDTYKCLLNPKLIQGGPVEADWDSKGVHLRQWQPRLRGQTVFTAQTGICWDNTRGLPVDCVFTRSEGETACFVTVMEPYKEHRRLKDVSASTAGDKTTVHLVFSTGSTRDIVFDAKSKAR